MSKHLIAVALLLVTGCNSYEKFVRNELKVPYVYLPPNNAHHPYTLFMYSKQGNFQAICSATQITALTEPQIRANLAVGNMANYGMKSAESTSVSVRLSKAEIGSAEGKYGNINRVQLTLSDGKLYTMPSVNISEAIDNISATPCLANARIYLAENPKAKFFLPTEVFGYDVRYRIFTSDGVDVTGEVPAELQKIVLGKAGVTYTADESVHMGGDGLYIGFRGTPIDASLAAAFGSNVQAPHVALVSGVRAVSGSEQSDSQSSFLGRIIDVTELVRGSPSGSR